GAVAFTEGRKAVADARMMLRILNYARTFGILLVQHAEEPSLASGGCMNEGETATRLGLPGILPAAETMMIERDLRLVEATGGRYHVAQISCAGSVAVIRRAKAAGLPVTCGVAAHHFALNEIAVGDYRTFAKTSPPLRTEDDRRAIVDAIADGAVDVIVSGHDPRDQESKRLPFAQAAHGVVGLETTLALALELHHNGGVGLVRLLHALSTAPATLLGLPGGQLNPGSPADLIVIDIDRPWRIDATRFRGKAKNSPFDGRPAQGRVVRTVVGGQTVFEAD
ncbi:MAG: amidohydrolase family protein, partial [Sphingomonadales bacterium]